MSSNLSKKATNYWKIVERVVDERCQKHWVSSPAEKLNSEYKDDEEEKKEEYSKERAIIIEAL